jgi:very-short-patch-repair endonuclease
MGAVLACEPHAALSHRSAAALWGFAKEHRDYVDVSVRRTSESRLSGVRCHRRPSLQSSETTARLNIPVTSPVRTFLDLATVAGPITLERAINEADKLDVIDPEVLRRALDEHPGEPGIRALRRVLDRDTFRLSDSELEVMFRPIARSVGLSEPLTKQMVNGFEVDFFWPDVGLVVETDGWRYHRTPAAQARDALRDQTHTASGLASLRFSHRQVKYEPAYVRGVLQRTMANLRGRPAPSTGR